jgi:hypothetical protein
MQSFNVSEVTRLSRSWLQLLVLVIERNAKHWMIMPEGQAVRKRDRLWTAVKSPAFYFHCVLNESKRVAIEFVTRFDFSVVVRDIDERALWGCNDHHGERLVAHMDLPLRVDSSPLIINGLLLE